MHAPLNLIQKETSSEVFFCADFCGAPRKMRGGVFFRIARNFSERVNF